MAKYELTATVDITIDGLTIYLDVEPRSQQDFSDAAEVALDRRLAVLDIKGSNSGDDGMITDISITDIGNWNRVD